MLLFLGSSKEREFPNIKYLETLSMMPFHDLSASDSVASYHYIRARGLGGDGPKDIISSVSAEFVVALRNNRVSKPKTEKPSLAE